MNIREKKIEREEKGTEHAELAQELLVHHHSIEGDKEKNPDLKYPENEDRQCSLQTSDKKKQLAVRVSIFWKHF